MCTGIMIKFVETILRSVILHYKCKLECIMQYLLSFSTKFGLRSIEYFQAPQNYFTAGKYAFEYS